MLESTSSKGSALIFSGLLASFSPSFSSNWVVEDSSATWNNGLVAVFFFFLVGGGNPVDTPADNELTVCLGILICDLLSTMSSRVCLSNCFYLVLFGYYTGWFSNIFIEFYRFSCLSSFRF